MLTAGGMVLPLTADVYALPLLMQIGYYAAHPVTLAVAFGGHQSQVTLPASPLAYADLPVQGPGNAVVITPVTPDPGGLHRHRDDRECTGLSDRHTGPGVPATRLQLAPSSSRRVQNG